MIDRDILKAVIADSQMAIPRFDVIPRKLGIDDNFYNYILVGIRRAGKSYMLYQRMQELLSKNIGWDSMLYINFEDERLEGMNLSDLNLLLEIHMEMYGKCPMLFLDEIQNIDGWEKFARRLADSKIPAYITGSNAKMLSQEMESKLGGRYVEKIVYPYSFREYLNVNHIDYSDQTLYSTEGKANVLRSFDDYFHYGGFPEVAQKIVKREYLSSTFNKIFLGDIIVRNSINNHLALRVLIKKLAESVKQPISYNRMKDIVCSTGSKIGVQTVINYVEYAEEAWLINPVHNIAGNIVNKETNPKYYFTDNGLLSLSLVDAETSLLENIIAVQLLRKYGREDSVFFYNDKIEVDFYIPEISAAIQSCYSVLQSNATFEREVSALLKFTKITDCKKLLIITRNEESTVERDGFAIKIIPVWKWLLEQE